MMFCPHFMCLDSDLVVQKINKQTNRQTDEKAMLPLFVLFKYSGIWIVHEIANIPFLLYEHVL